VAPTRSGRVPCMDVMWGGRRIAGMWVALAVQPLAKSGEMEWAATYAVAPTSLRGIDLRGILCPKLRNPPMIDCI